MSVTAFLGNALTPAALHNKESSLHLPPKLGDNSGFGIILSGMSLLTCPLTVISVDRLLGLLLGLRQKPVVTLKRIYVIVIVCFFFFFFFLFFFFFFFCYFGLSIRQCSVSRLFLETTRVSVSFCLECHC